MTGRTITATTRAWITSPSGSHPLEGEPGEVVNALGFSAHDMSDVGWIAIGEATITVFVPDEAGVVQAQVHALRQQLQTLRAKAEARATEIEWQIQNLLSIGYSAEVAA